MSETLKSDAQMVLKALSSILFEECYPLSRDFEPVPSNPGFYAFRYRDEILYIGIGNNLRRRFP
ncbi:hypothetical protein JOY44_30945 (plasmid) [Phormidium sp. CLA17]|uniref:hypothetical protein n=1 Tax=Leptolyngbya sp. Cla-17 TaxID=2803751 RepID=UPI001491D925|nr:hypothetical protein [Leptolyngbya sp. Cla-17]MBM0745792.1 hypothetical protein [Leptolyngbya sp. Cla-17]